jgi:hypothetical protein
LKIVSVLFALVLAVSLVLPAAVMAAEGYNGLAKCEWDPVKWEANPNSWNLYLQHWGRTPIQAMTRLAGLCGNDTLCREAHGVNSPTAAKSEIYGDPNACYSGCPACRTVEQGALATCDDPVACSESLCETAACEATAQVDCKTCPSERVIEKFEPTCCCVWGVSLAFANKAWAGASIGTHPRINDNHLNHFGISECYGGNKGGDWGITGAPHTECCSLTWALQDNCFGKPYGDKCAPN